MSRKQSQKLHFVGAAILVFHLYFFPHSTKLRGLPLSTVTVSLHYLSRCLRSTAALQDLWPNLQKKARKRPIKLLKEAKHSSETDQRSQTLNLIKPRFKTACALTTQFHTKIHLVYSVPAHKAIKSKPCSEEIYLSHSHPIAIYACPIPWNSHYIIIILIWNTIQLKLLNLWKFKFSIYKIGLHVQRDMQNDKIYWL